MRYYVLLLSTFLFLGCGPGDHMDDDSMETSTALLEYR